MKVCSIEPSPNIQESLVFGFTDGRKALELENSLHSIEVQDCRVIRIDMVFGHIIVSMPNPAIDVMKYAISRQALLQEIKYKVQKSENE